MHDGVLLQNITAKHRKISATAGRQLEIDGSIHVWNGVVACNRADVAHGENKTWRVKCNRSIGRKARRAGAVEATAGNTQCVVEVGAANIAGNITCHGNRAGRAAFFQHLLHRFRAEVLCWRIFLTLVKRKGRNSQEQYGKEWFFHVASSLNVKKVCV